MFKQGHLYQIFIKEKVRFLLPTFRVANAKETFSNIEVPINNGDVCMFLEERFNGLDGIWCQQFLFKGYRVLAHEQWIDNELIMKPL